jgi:taurine---2-oxoglutarate transaminase
MANGVYIQAGMSHFVIAPPLIISKEDIDFGISILDEALSVADAEADKGGTAVTAANK